MTSAETVLIQEQSYDKLLVAMGDSTAVVVVQISPQSRSSLADALGLSNEAAFLYIAALLKSLGAGYVIDSSSGGDIALIEARDEFLERCCRDKCLKFLLVNDNPNFLLPQGI